MRGRAFPNLLKCLVNIIQNTHLKKKLHITEHITHVTFLKNKIISNYKVYHTNRYVALHRSENLFERYTGCKSKKAVKQKFYKKYIYTRRKCTNKISQKYNE